MHSRVSWRCGNCAWRGVFWAGNAILLRMIPTGRLLGLLLAALAAIHAASYWNAGPIDDEYINYVYARNLVEGKGLVFNEGERVEGFTDPLWVLLLAAAHACGLPFQDFTRIIGILASALAVFFLHLKWSTSAESRQAYLLLCSPALMVACSPELAWHSAAGLGTALSALLVAFWLWASGRPRWQKIGTLAAGLSTLIRPELSVLAALLALIAARKGKYDETALALAPAGLWFAFRRVYYGQWLPMTFLVKKLPLADDLHFGLAYVSNLGRNGAYLALVVLATAASLARIRSTAERLKPLDGLTIAAAWLGLMAIIWEGGDHMPLGRYLVPWLPLVSYAAVVALRSYFPYAAQVAVVAGICIANLWGLWDERVEVFRRQEVETSRWVTIGKELEHALAPHESIATSPIGAIKYYSNKRVVDILGLTNKYTFQAQPSTSVTLKGHQRVNYAGVLAEKPTLMVLGNGRLLEDEAGRPQFVLSAWEGPFLNEETFQNSYGLAIIPMPDLLPLVCYFRQGIPLPNRARWLQ